MSLIPPRQQRSKFQDSVKVKEHNNERDAGVSHIEKRIIANRSSNNPKTLRSMCPSPGVDSEERYKYMSRPPNHLAHLNKGGSLQGNALKVGVLNWDHVDKWKHNQHQGGVIETRVQDSSYASRNSLTSLSSKLYYESYPPIKQRASITSTVGFVPGEPNRERIICLLSPQKPISSGQQRTSNTDRYISGNCSNLHHAREKDKEIPSSNLKEDEFCINSMPVGVYETKKVLDLLDKSRNKNLAQTELYAEIKRTISSMRSIKNANMPKNSTIADDKLESKIEKQLGSSDKSNCQLSPTKKENIIVLVNRDAPSTPGNGLLPESQTSPDEALKSNWSSVSEVFSERGSLSNQVSEFSHSPPFRYPYCDEDASTYPNTDQNEKDVHNVTVQPKVYRGFSNVESSDFICVPGRELVSEHREFSPVESSLTSDHTLLDLSHQTPPNYRSQSPLRHLSNGFSKMRKSLSTKDNSVVLSNSKRFPASVGVPSSQDIPIQDKSEAPKKARSSPLRRLIDPILKPKVTITSSYVDDHNQSAIGYKMLAKASEKASSFCQIERKTENTVQALLQCSTKNGLPMFKFVSKKKGDALVATLADTPTHEKSDLSLNFTLYSVNEMTKNSSWKYHGRVGKNTGYLYNVVGQIRLCILSTNKTTDDVRSSKHFTGVESTLFGVQPSKTDQETIKVKPSGELAALIMTSNDNEGILESGYTMEKFLKDLSECFSKNSLSNITGCCKRSNTTVILPAGVHSMPNKGAPSPLIHRLRSGGSCDCGGWDIGCNLNLLRNKKDEESCKPVERSECSPASECFQLFSKTGAHGKGPLFRLTSFDKEIYSVDFKPSLMSDLQAFFISVTVLSSLVTSDLSEGTE